MVVIKRFKVLLRFDIVEYYRGIESGSTGLEMALNEVFDILYIIDILYYTIVNDNWGIGCCYSYNWLCIPL